MAQAIDFRLSTVLSDEERAVLREALSRYWEYCDNKVRFSHDNDQDTPAAKWARRADIVAELEKRCLA